MILVKNYDHVICLFRLSGKYVAPDWSADINKCVTIMMKQALFRNKFNTLHQGIHHGINISDLKD